MPTLNWIGKDRVINHHLEVPFRTLLPSYSFGDEESAKGNLIIHGDNLEALKALLPQYEGKVNLIYIDPPYNTGNEGWIYNDNVNDPKMKKWLGEVVGKEGEDLSRHDKWLCMMHPRLKLLHKLLSDDGIIAISIDDNEIFNLGLIVNDIFGAQNRLACAPWQSEPSGGKGKSGLRIGHEYLLIYAKSSASKILKEEISTGDLNLSDKFGKYRKGRELNKWGDESLREDRPDMWFPLLAPDGSEVFPIRNDGKEGRWRWGKDNPMIKLLLTDPQYAHWEIRSFDDGITYKGKKERWFPYEKIRERTRARGWSTWLDKFGYNAHGTEEIKKIFGTKIFDTIKPTSLINWLISLYDDDNALILDSFAGSGTTAHAVLKLNLEDGGNRKFILIEMEDYAETITAERVRRVISGYGTDSKKTLGTGGGFSYHTLGPVLFTKDGMLNPEVDDLALKQYIWYAETKTAIPTKKLKHKYYLGSALGISYYLYYIKGEDTVLDFNFLKTVKDKDEHYVIYADSCSIDSDFLKKGNITFKKIPRDIPRY